MIPSTFQYNRANTLDEAVELLSQKEEAKILAGGHSLLPAMKLRLNRPENLIDITRIPQMKGIRQEGNDLVIGAATTHNEIAVSDLVKDKLPLLTIVGGAIGDVQVRNMGTIGGSIAHADPAADWPAALLATDATVLVKNKQGNRTILASDFFTGMFATALKENELITEIRFPIPESNTKSAYLKFLQPASRFAIVGCAISFAENNGMIQNVRVAFSGVSEHAFRDLTTEKALEGKKLEDTLIESVALQAAEGVFVLSDHFASEEYRKHLAKLYCKRTLLSLK